MIGEQSTAAAVGQRRSYPLVFPAESNQNWSLDGRHSFGGGELLHFQQIFCRGQLVICKVISAGHRKDKICQAKQRANKSDLRLEQQNMHAYTKSDACSLVDTVKRTAVKRQAE